MPVRSLRCFVPSSSVSHRRGRAPMYAVGPGLFLGLMFGLSGESMAADSDDPCPKGWHYERTSIFHSGPKSRLVGNKSHNGRVCVDLRRPHPNDPALQYNDGCPRGWDHERVGILHDGPKDRLVGGSYYKSPGWNQKRYTCIALTRPGAAIYNPDLSYDPGGNYHRMDGVAVWGAADDLGKVTVPSENVCRAMCGAGDLCRGYLWNETSKTCIPKSGFAKTLRHDPGTVTVLRSREAKSVKRYYSQQHQETRVRTLTVSGARGGDDSSRLFRSARGQILGRRNNPGVQSEDLCQNICLWNDDCKGVRYFSRSDRCEEITRLGGGRGNTAYQARR